jgi:hypothetical protein
MLDMRCSLYVPALGNQSDNVRGSRPSSLHILISWKLSEVSFCPRLQSHIVLDLQCSLYIPALGNQTDRVRGSRASRLHILIIKLAKATGCLRAQHLSTHTKSDFTTMQGFGGLRSKHNRHVMEIHIITRIARHITLSTDAFCTAQVAASHEPKPTIPQRGERLLAPAVASHPGLPAAASHEPKQARLWLRQRSRSVANASSRPWLRHTLASQRLRVTRQSSGACGCVSDPRSVANGPSRPRLRRTLAAPIPHCGDRLQHGDCLQCANSEPSEAFEGTLASNPRRF